jgi:hypothetical protein
MFISFRTHVHSYKFSQTFRTKQTFNTPDYYITKISPFFPLILLDMSFSLSFLYAMSIQADESDNLRAPQIYRHASAARSCRQLANR